MSANSLLSGAWRGVLSPGTLWTDGSSSCLCSVSALGQAESLDERIVQFRVRLCRGRADQIRSFCWRRPSLRPENCADLGIERYRFRGPRDISPIEQTISNRSTHPGPANLCPQTDRVCLIFSTFSPLVGMQRRARSRISVTEWRLEGSWLVGTPELLDLWDCLDYHLRKRNFHLLLLSVLHPFLQGQGWA